SVQPQLDPNASPVGEIFRYTLESKNFSPMVRKEWQDWLLGRRFKSINGVVDVTGYGGPTKIYEVELDPNRLRALNL
ncbi:efflux RND transporter permease subunit, partial [Acinetobacter baumannii]